MKNTAARVAGWVSPGAIQRTTKFVAGQAAALASVEPAVVAGAMQAQLSRMGGQPQQGLPGGGGGLGGGFGGGQEPPPRDFSGLQGVGGFSDLGEQELGIAGELADAIRAAGMTVEEYQLLLHTARNDPDPARRNAARSKVLAIGGDIIGESAESQETGIQPRRVIRGGTLEPAAPVLSPPQGARSQLRQDIGQIGPGATTIGGRSDPASIERFIQARTEFDRPPRDIRPFLEGDTDTSRFFASRGIFPPERPQGEPEGFATDADRQQAIDAQEARAAHLAATGEFAPITGEFAPPLDGGFGGTDAGVGGGANAGVGDLVRGVIKIDRAVKEFASPVTNPAGTVIGLQAGLLNAPARAALQGLDALGVGGAGAVADKIPDIARSGELGGELGEEVFNPINLIPIPVVDPVLAKVLGLTFKLGAGVGARFITRIGRRVSAQQARAIFREASEFLARNSGAPVKGLREFVEALGRNLDNALPFKGGQGEVLPTLARAERQVKNAEQLGADVAERAASRGEVQQGLPDLISENDALDTVPLRKGTTDAIDELHRIEDSRPLAAPDEQIFAAQLEVEAHLRNELGIPKVADGPADLVDRLMDNIIRRPEARLTRSIAGPVDPVTVPGATLADEQVPAKTGVLPGLPAADEPTVRVAKVGETIGEGRVIFVDTAQIEVRPDLFQSRTIDQTGSGTGAARVAQISDNWDINKFTPPTVIEHPDKPGVYIMREGHHRTPAWIANENPKRMPVMVVEADLSDPAVLAEQRVAAVASNFSVAEMSVVEQARSVGILSEAGRSLDDIAADLRMTPGHVQDLQDILLLPSGVVDRLAQEPILAPIASEIGRGVRLHGMSTNDALASFNRWAIRDPARSNKLSTRGAVRDWVDKFAPKLKGRSFFDTGQLPGVEGRSIDSLSLQVERKTDALNFARRQVTRDVNAANRLGKRTGTSTTKLAAAGKREVKALEAELKSLEDDFLKALDNAPDRIAPPVRPARETGLTDPQTAANAQAGLDDMGVPAVAGGSDGFVPTKRCGF